MISYNLNGYDYMDEGSSAQTAPLGVSGITLSTTQLASRVVPSLYWVVDNEMPLTSNGAVSKELAKRQQLAKHSVNL